MTPQVNKESPYVAPKVSELLVKDKENIENIESKISPLRDQQVPADIVPKYNLSPKP